MKSELLVAAMQSGDEDERTLRPRRLDDDRRAVCLGHAHHDPRFGRREPAARLHEVAEPDQRRLALRTALTESEHRHLAAVHVSSPHGRPRLSIIGNTVTIQF